jgi:hypothetical protein
MDIDLERSIRQWRAALAATAHLPPEDAQELEDHLRDEIETLRAAGLSPDEAMLVAARRIGNIHEVAGQLAVIDADRAWRQTFAPGPDTAGDRPSTGISPLETAMVAGAALLAALLGKLPRVFGVEFGGAGLEVYLRNLALFVAPVLIGAYYLRRRFSPGILAFVGVTVLAAALAANLYPFAPVGMTSFLVVLHLPLLLWLALGLAYAGDDWRTVRLPLDFLRFTGELVLYSVLIGCGGVVFVALVVALFSAAGLDVVRFAAEYLAFSILLATPVVAAYFVEKKRSLIENLAPVLARIFIPLFLLMMLALIVTVAIQGQVVFASRDVLILVNVLLLLVAGMVLYDLSARRDEPAGRMGAGHWLNLALILAALVIDCIALYAVAARVAGWGPSANKAAALGANILLLINLAGLAVAYLSVAAGKATMARVLAWQVRYLPVYFVWFACVVFAFPPLFGFR